MPVAGRRALRVNDPAGLGDGLSRVSDERACLRPGYERSVRLVAAVDKGFRRRAQADSLGFRNEATPGQPIEDERGVQLDYGARNGSGDVARAARL